jgi:hypothetical protein
MNLPTKPTTYLLAIMFAVVCLSAPDLEVDHPRILFGMALATFAFCMYCLYDSFANSPYNRMSKENREAMRQIEREAAEARKALESSRRLSA